METDSPVGPVLRDEVQLNHQAWQVAFQVWRNKGSALVPIGMTKLSAFWLSTDQLIDPRSISWRNRALRWTGVAAYCVVLLLAASSWWRTCLSP
jgi:hypothetical protein